ncbi:serine/threonine-protein kinase PknD [Mycobacterium kyorinense]|uniref:serine/threonine-protein kinase PknD n=1 Tax=Mycobacterium kyorinense TaxID=487514 RepID=UPI000AD0E7E7|nr:serine/threonine-protein kinase PknD [Mycobacterium kyorinense]
MAGQDAEDETPFGRYRLLSMLGEGGMGEVWRAHDTITDRVVAIKVLSAKLSKDEDFQRRFRREAHSAARLETPHVVPIYDYGEIGDRLFVCMRLIKGRDLATVLADGPLKPARAVRIIGQVAEALYAAHEIGLIHRDIKPSNILLDDRDFAYLIDFGIARVVDDTRITKIGNTIGTFAYIAPERLHGEGEEDARADIYSLACVLYECLTGEPPFAADTVPRLIVAHMSSPPPRPSTTRPEVPAQVDDVIATGMAKDPDQRYATTVELADAARDAITEPIQKPAGNPPRLRATEPAPGPTLLDDVTRPASAPGRRPVPQPRPVDQPSPQIGKPPPPSGHRPRRRMQWPLIALGIVFIVLWLIFCFSALPGLPIFGLSPDILLVLGVMLLVVGLVLMVVHQKEGTGFQGRRRTLALIAGAIALVAVTTAAIGISALSKYIVLPFTGLKEPTGVAADSSGNLYVADTRNDRVLKLAAGSSTQEVLPFTGLNWPGGVAVDTAGNLYVTNIFNDRVLKLAAGSSTQEVLPFTGLKSTVGVAVDSAGNVYVIDEGNNQVLKLAAGSSTQEVLPFTGLRVPIGVAVDSTGTVYVTDAENQRVLKLAAGSSTQEVLPFTGLKRTGGVAVDSAGTVYVADNTNDRVLKLAAGSSTQEVLPFTGLPFTGLKGPEGVAVDSAGNFYVADQLNNRVLKLPVG